jgi:hypothetical protein
MRIFNHPAITDDWKCPICNTNEDKPVTLIAISGTRQGNNMRAEQFHVDCLNLIWIKDSAIIVQNLDEHTAFD